jgi:hypothetical protein
MRIKASCHGWRVDPNHLYVNAYDNPVYFDDPLGLSGYSIGFTINLTPYLGSWGAVNSGIQYDPTTGTVTPTGDIDYGGIVTAPINDPTAVSDFQTPTPFAAPPLQLGLTSQGVGFKFGSDYCKVTGTYQPNGWDTSGLSQQQTKLLNDLMYPVQTMINLFNGIFSGLDIGLNQ